jgi:hypothetical protein
VALRDPKYSSDLKKKSDIKLEKERMVDGTAKRGRK